MHRGSYAGRIFIAVFVVFVFAFISSCEKAPVTEASLRGGEKRETLSPAYYTGKTAMAYRAAKEIPEIIDSLYCYCDCAKHYGHKSLLTCFVTTHGQNCGVCMDEAIMAHKMSKDVKDVFAIRKAIDAKFSR